MKHVRCLLFVLAACGTSQLQTNPRSGAQSASGSSGGQTATSSSSSGGSGASSSSGGNGSGLTRTTFGSTMQALVCNNIAASCPSAGYTFSFAACQQGVGQWFDDPGSGATFSTENAAACTAATPEDVAAGQLPSACWSVWTGTIAAGAACSNNLVCAAGANGYAYCNQGFCVEMNTSSTQGATCDETPTQAEPDEDICDSSQNLYCGSDSTCVSAAAEGASCAALYCQDGLYCNTSNMCAWALATGETCTADQYYPCVDSDYCAPSSGGGKSCAPRLAITATCVPSTEDNNYADSGCANYACSAVTHRCYDPSSIVGAPSCENQTD